MAGEEIETIFEYVSEKGQSGKLGIDKNNRLYWKNKPLLVEQKITLNLWVNIAIILASLSTVFTAIISALKFFCNN